MLTIKLIENNGHEQIHEVKKVWANFQDQGNEVLATNSEGDLLQFGPPGVIYVMNEQGQTIARYELISN